MFRSTIQFASHVKVPKHHVPLIKFLGKRSLIQNHTDSRDDMVNTSQEPKVDKFGTVLYVLNSESDLPTKYRRSPPSSQEADLIELGGAY
ncbi:hypothetical protein DSO57_1025310 [Entomophthora muscae]|uniref:Uncharacterized protein n=1 Tax=Entomophthora muscae TaxID=34485 RepID=A0ACC2S438_9FUNG|nr:hypothetical protein DSO57_1025310 [Entomophthora muscae]